MWYIFTSARPSPFSSIKELRETHDNWHKITLQTFPSAPSSATPYKGKIIYSAQFAVLL